MRDIRLYLDEITGFILHDLLEFGAELVAHSALQDIKDQLETDVDVRAGNATGRYGRDIGGEFRRAGVLRRHALFVMNAVPIAPRAAASDRQYAVVIFYCAKLEVVPVRLHGVLLSMSSPEEEQDAKKYSRP